MGPWVGPGHGGSFPRTKRTHLSCFHRELREPGRSEGIAECQDRENRHAKGIATPGIEQPWQWKDLEWSEGGKEGGRKGGRGKSRG